MCPLTTNARGLALHVKVEATADTGLSDTSYVQCELLRSVNQRRLVHRLGNIDPAAAHRVDDVVRTLLGH